MKKLFTIVLAFATVGLIFAQQFAGKQQIEKFYQLPFKSSVKTPTDTCGFSPYFIPEFAPSQQVYLYSYTGGGYVFGNNVDGVNTCAQGYVYQGTVGIEGCAFLFGAKHQTANSTMTVKAYLVNGQAKNENNTTTPGPGTLLGSTTLTMSQVDTTWPNFTIVSFAQPLAATNDFAVAIDFNQLSPNGDTAGLVCDMDGDANQLDYAFHQYMGTWYVTDYAFGGLDVNIAIFPIVNRNYVGLDAEHSFYGMRSNSYPNPASDQVTIEYVLDNSTEVTIEILGSNGQLIAEYKQGLKQAGKHSFDVNVSNFASGKYYFSIKSNGKRLIKSFDIVK
ncbi:MAG: T9SS type A sorting domain-containing protein [Bacteroidales bacterium]|nr:T9SS type A sorting domain-containing protein [Bacteroidales bacterium]